MAEKGRPTVYDPALCDQVIGWGAEGKSLTWMAAQIGISRETIYEWERTREDFSDALSRARALCQAWWEDQGQAGMLTPGFNAAVWTKNVASRFRHDWSDKTTLEHTGAGGGAMQIEAIQRTVVDPKA